MRPRGRPVVSSASFVVGTLLSVRRVNLGEELPWSIATKGIEAGGGRCCSIVG